MKADLFLLPCLLLSLCLLPAAASAQPPADFAVVNATVIVGDGTQIDGGTVVVRSGMIESVAANLTPPSGIRAIDAEGAFLYPGFIDAGTFLGLQEISSLPETRDERELGDITPYARALTAVNPSSVSIPVTRVNGITTVLTRPRGGIYPGRGAVIRLHGYSAADLGVGGVEPLIITWPTKPEEEQVEKREKGRGDDPMKAWREALQRIDRVWEEAVAYARLDSVRGGTRASRIPGAVWSAELDAMIPAVRGEVPVIFEVNRARDIDTALGWIAARGIKRPVLAGVKDGWRVASRIAASGVPVIVGPVLTLPSNAYDRFDRAYRNAALLHEAGVRLAFRTNETENVRNLPYHVGFAVAHGLPRGVAIASLTSTAAEILGVSEWVGTVAPGKEATFFISDGDPLEPATDIRNLFIAGYEIPLSSRHVELYEHYIDRPQLQR